MMNTIPEIIEDLKLGKMIILVDDEDRENEGDFVCAAEFVTPETINFMLNVGRGMLCLALDATICEKLELPQQSAVNTTFLGTAYTLTIDAELKYGITTGVSAHDRAKTINVAIDPDTKPLDLARPGHMQPLRAKPGGVLVRAGQTEGSVDLCKLAGLKPGAAIIEIMNDDGTMARRPELDVICKEHDIKICSVAQLIQYRMRREKLVQRIDEVPFENQYGKFNLIAYQSKVDPLPHVALVCGDIGKKDANDAPMEYNKNALVRMHSQNLLGDVFSDLNNPSSGIINKSMQMIQENGSGALVYLRHDKMGQGLLKKLHTMHPSIHLEQEAQPPVAAGDYGIGAQILRDLGISKLDLISNRKIHPASLEGFGLTIENYIPIPKD